MATTTPNYGWNVPTSADYVAQGAVAIQTLGDEIDATVFGLPSGALALVKTQVIGSAVTSVEVTGAFSATYDNYHILINGGVGSLSSNFNLKLGASTTGYYYGINWVAVGGTSGVIGGSNQASWNQVVGGFNVNNINGNFTLQNPFLAKYTNLNAQFMDSTQARSGNGYHGVATSYTDFTVTCAAGNVTGGTIRVYGYQN